LVRASEADRADDCRGLAGGDQGAEHVGAV
jgi:hypothetical protein